MRTFKILSLSVLFFLILGTLISIVAITHRSNEPTSDPHSGSIVRLVKDGRTFCSGVVVSPSVIITASHCVLVETPFGPMLSTDSIEIRANDDQPTNVFGTPYGVRIQLDQVLLEGDFHEFKMRKYTTDLKELDSYRHKEQTMWSCGYPMGGPLFCSKMVYQDVLQFMWATNGLLIPGMSGGPVILDDGTVVAINVAVEGNQSLLSPIYNLSLKRSDK